MARATDARPKCRNPNGDSAATSERAAGKPRGQTRGAECGEHDRDAREDADLRGRQNCEDRVPHHQWHGMIVRAEFKFVSCGF